MTNRLLACTLLAMSLAASIPVASAKPVREQFGEDGSGPVEETQWADKEQALYRLIMAYRSRQHLPAIPLSKSLTRVARLHVADLRDHRSSRTECNMHSWSTFGPWTPVCYTPDHKQAKAMWDKPRELTDYTGNGFEIAVGGPRSTITPAKALTAWQGSPGHNNVIVNRSAWQKSTWQAIGVGINERYSVVWFGEEPDPDQP